MSKACSYFNRELVPTFLNVGLDTNNREALREVPTLPYDNADFALGVVASGSTARSTPSTTRRSRLVRPSEIHI